MDTLLDTPAETQAQAGADARLGLRVQSIAYAAQGILSFELRAAYGDELLPAFSAGAHIDLHLPNGLRRSYSLLNPPHERTRYVIGVNLDAASRGGSRYLHESLRPGEVIPVSPPRNDFALAEDAPFSLLIAGGIGITPLWCMIQRLEALGRPWRLLHAARSRAHAALRDELAALEAAAPGRVLTHYDDEHQGCPPDLAALVAGAPAGTHFYCCGPQPMMQAFAGATAQVPAPRVHVEYFAAQEAPADAGGYTVVLQRSGKRLEIAPGQTILQALLDAGLDPLYSCCSGVCGTCEATVLEGEPDHRDMVLTPEEQAGNRRIMICCSGARSATLVLDL